MLDEERPRRLVRGPVGRLMVACYIAVTLTACGSAGRDVRPASRPATATRPAEDINRLDEAVDELRRVYEEDRSNSNQMKLGEAESRAADAHVALAEQYLRENRLHAARTELATALSHVPAHPRANMLVRQVERDIQRIDELNAQAQEAIGHQDYTSALQLTDQALTITPGDPKLNQQRKELVARRAADLQDQYEQRALKDEWELAWPVAVRATMLQRPDDEKEVQNLARAEEMIRERIGYRLRVVPVASEEVSAAQLLATAAALAGELERIKPTQIEVLPFQVTSEALASSRLRLAEVSDPAKLKTMDGELTGKDVCLFVELGGPRAQRTDGGRADRPERTTLEQARVDLQQAREKLGRARQLAQADGRKWDDRAARALATDDTFLPEALAGTYGPQARQAAEGYQAALRRLQQTPGSPGGADQRSRLNARLRLVVGLTGEVLWSEDNTAVEAPVGGGANEMPAIRHLARQALVRRSLAYLEAARKAQGDERMTYYVRFLFDCSVDPGAEAIAEAIDAVFNERTVGGDWEACRKVVSERLRLRFAAAAAAQPDVGTPKTVAATPAAPANASAQTAPAPALPSLTPRYRVEPEQIFDGYVSRDDKRYPRERAVVDGITVKVRDTDADPLDADLEVTVGKYRGSFDDLRVGMRLRVRGASGQEYRLTIVGIEDRYETVRFSLERLPEQAGR
jgi:hypothetical protein